MNVVHKPLLNFWIQTKWFALNSTSNNNVSFIPFIEVPPFIACNKRKYFHALDADIKYIFFIQHSGSHSSKPSNFLSSISNSVFLLFPKLLSWSFFPPSFALSLQFLVFTDIRIQFLVFSSSQLVISSELHYLFQSFSY
jgi:hypothetical protein